MDILVSIPDEVYDYDRQHGYDVVDTLDAFLTDYFCGTHAKITKLPKAHGDLIDKSDLLTTTDIRVDGSEFTYVSYNEIEDAPIIIEAEREGGRK